MTAMTMGNWLQSKWWKRHRTPDQPGASEKLVATAKELREHIQPYLNEPDPLAALMTDIFNKRQLQRQEGEPDDKL